jgi:hypothetical protein
MKTQFNIYLDDGETKELIGTVDTYEEADVLVIENYYAAIKHAEKIGVSDKINYDQVWENTRRLYPIEEVKV